MFLSLFLLLFFFCFIVVDVSFDDVKLKIDLKQVDRNKQLIKLYISLVQVSKAAEPVWWKCEFFTETESEGESSSFILL